MRPCKYTVKHDKTIFHYTFTDLRKFLTLGLKEGNVGMILMEWDGNHDIYRGFGTIENPNTSLSTFTIMHYDAFDGKRPVPNEIVHPVPNSTPLVSYRIVFIDSEEYNGKPNIKQI